MQPPNQSIYKSKAERHGSSETYKDDFSHPLPSPYLSINSFMHPKKCLVHI
jgi:hypothetical protein